MEHRSLDLMMETRIQANVLPDKPSATDGELLRDFVTKRSESAFEMLVRRHGPLVLGVCRRLLGNEHDAADAFQAAFLVLARKAATIRTPEVLGAWLYNVAYRTSLKARALICKRKARERQVEIMPEPVLEAALPDSDVYQVLDEEVRALPARLQAAVILCDLQGQSRKEAAARLKLPEGTLSSRLNTARKRLAARLKRRGITVSAVALAATLAEGAASASVPAPLVVAAVQSAVGTQAVASAISSQVAALADGVVKSMLIAKLQLALLAFLSVCLVAAMVQVAHDSPPAEPNPEENAAAELEKIGARIHWESTASGKKVHLVNLKGRRAEDRHLKLLPIFSNLRNLVLSETLITDAGCPDIARLHALQSLRLDKTGVTDVGVKHLAALPRLRALSVSETRITGAALAAISKLGEIRMLDLSATSIGDDDLKQLACLEKLHHLELGRTPVTDAGLGHLKEIPELSTLRLGYTAISDAGMKDLVRCPKIESLAIDGNPRITNAAIPQLAPLAGLMALNLSSTKVNDEAIADLANFKQLSWLALDRTAVTGRGLKEAAPLLTTLWLAGTQLSDDSMDQVTTLDRLESLNIERTAVTDASMPAIARIKTLIALNVSETKTTDAGLAELARLTHLRSLSLHKTEVTDNGLRRLLPLKDLESLWISWTKISASGVKELASFKKLGVLRLGGLPITDLDLRDLAVHKNLHTLWLDWTKISDHGLHHLAALPNLEELRLDGTEITLTGLKQLAPLNKLRTVELRQTQVPLEAAAALALPQHAGESSGADGANRRVLLFLGGLLAFLFTTALLWSAVKRRSVVGPAITCCMIGLTVILGHHLLQAQSPAPPGNDSQLGERRLRGHSGPVQTVHFSRDGKRLISASGWPGNDTTVRIWDVDSAKEIHQIKTSGQIGAFEIHPDGKVAVVGAYGAILCISIESGEVVQSARLPTTTSALSIAADGKHFYTASHDGFVRRWNFAAFKETARYRVPGKWARGVAELPGDKLFTADDRGVLQIWDIKTGMEIKRIEASVNWLSLAVLAPGRRQALVGSWSVRVWDLESGELLRRFEGHEHDISEIVFSADGKTLLTASFDGTVRLWDYETGELLQVLHTQEEFVCAAAISPDGKQVAFAGGGRKEGSNFKPGEDHDIRIVAMPAPMPPAVAASSPRDQVVNWRPAILIVIALAVIAVSALLFFFRRGRAARARQGKGTSAAILFPCPNCGAGIKVKTAHLGKRIKCPKCAASATVA